MIDADIAQALSEMIENWSKSEAAARLQFPAATDEEIYIIVKSKMNRSLGLTNYTKDVIDQRN